MYQRLEDIVAVLCLAFMALAFVVAVVRLI
jgi:hypothetical protein